MRRIQNKQNGRIAQITDTYQKDGVVITYELTYEDDGKTTNLSSSTVKRWWKDVEPTEQEAAVEEASTYVAASQAITKELNKNNHYSLEEMVEKQAQLDSVAVAVEVKEKEVKKGETKTRKNGKSEIITVITSSDVDRDAIKQNIWKLAEENHFSVVDYARLPYFLVLKAFGRGRIEVRVGKKGLSLNVKEEVASFTSREYHTVKNYYLPAVIQLSYETDYDTELKILFALAYEYAQNTSKSQKEEK